MTHHRRWTQTDITEARHLCTGDLSLTDLATALQRSPDDVAAMLRRLRLTVRPV